jgi:hypothetical protein
MLINKFKLKYGDKPSISKYIDNEVDKFLKNDRLTEDNLKRLDNKILKESELRDKKEMIMDDRKSQKSRAGSQRPGSTASRRGDLVDDKYET